MLKHQSERPCSTKYHIRLRVDADGGPQAARAARRHHREHKVHRVVVRHVVGFERVRAGGARAAGRHRIREVRAACGNVDECTFI